MKAILYIGIILACRVVQAIFNKRSSMEIDGMPAMIRFSTLQYVIATLLGGILILTSGNGFRCQTLTVLIALFSGICLLSATVLGVYGMKEATVSVNSMFATAGMLVPLLAGIFLFHHPIQPLQWVGVGLFFLSAWLLLQNSRSETKGIRFRTVLILIGALLTNGGTMLAQQMFTAYVPEGDVLVFSFITFGVIALGGTVAVLILHIRERRASPALMVRHAGKSRLSGSLTVSAVALALAVFFINQLATICTAMISPVILFTFINGGGTIIATVVAAVCFREKLTVRSVSGVLTGIVSLVIIKLFA